LFIAFIAAVSASAFASGEEADIYAPGREIIRGLDHIATSISVRRCLPLADLPQSRRSCAGADHNFRILECADRQQGGGPARMSAVYDGKCG
jgi:hypothetical protein